MIGETGIQKTTSSVGRGSACRVTNNEKEFCLSRIFEDRLEAVGLAGQPKLRGARDRLRVACTYESGKPGRLVRVVREPSSCDSIPRVRRIPSESVKAG